MHCIMWPMQIQVAPVHDKLLQATGPGHILHSEILWYLSLHSASIWAVLPNLIVQRTSSPWHASQSLFNLAPAAL